MPQFILSVIGVVIYLIIPVQCSLGQVTAEDMPTEEVYIYFFLNTQFMYLFLLAFYTGTYHLISVSESYQDYLLAMGLPKVAVETVARS